MITPPPTARGQRRITYARLRHMQADLNPKPTKGITMSASAFSAPSSTEDFMQRYPSYIEGWLRRRMDLTPAEMAELKASAIKYLSAAPTDPVLAELCVERIQTFAYTQVWQVKATHFLQFVNMNLLTWITSPTHKPAAAIKLRLEVA
jgi:hypothetical protein